MASRRSNRPFGISPARMEALEGRQLLSAASVTAFCVEAGVPALEMAPQSALAMALDVGLSSSGAIQVAKGSPADPLSAEQKLRADRLISAFENSTTTLQYAYIENLDDGRGFTAGRAGFTTATGDFLIVVDRYTRQKPGNPLAKYLRRLRQLARAESDSTAGLRGIAAAWRRAARTAGFRAIQDQVVDEVYFQPAVRRWRSLGAQTALSLVAIYDTIIQHGEGRDPDGLPALIRRATARAGGTPADGVVEADWLAAFLAERWRTLSRAADPDTRSEWRASRDRVTALRRIQAAGNYSLSGPLRVRVYGDAFRIP